MSTFRRGGHKIEMLLQKFVACDKKRFRHFGFWPLPTSAIRRAPHLLCLVGSLGVLSGCSVHPIPDDVSPIPTEEIVRSARCEMRLGLFAQVKRLLEKQGIQNVDVRELQTPEGRKKIFPVPPPGLKAILDDYGQVAVAYDFEFDIAERDIANASLGFRIPYLSPSAFDLGVAGGLTKLRTAKRTFSAQETFLDLIMRNDWCDKFETRDRNIVYPITGSIGLTKAVGSFMALAEQGGGKDSFVDALAFTTTIGGSITPSVKLNPVPHSFRLINASGALSAERTDLHKVKISLAFPVPAKPKKKNPMILSVDPNETGMAPYIYNPVWRARYNICVADAREREDALKTLRFSPPEVYCIEYADTFVPREPAAVSAARRAAAQPLPPQFQAPSAPMPSPGAATPEAGSSPDARQGPSTQPERRQETIRVFPTPPTPAPRERTRTPSWW